MQDNGDSFEGNFKVSKTGFDIALNLGLRTNITANHGLEVAVRVPFLKTQLFNAKDNNGANVKLGQNFRVLARYSFGF